MTEKRTIEQHIVDDKKILEDELQHLERYAEEHKKDIEAGDHHDPSAFEMFCDENPDADECRIYED